MAWRLMEESVPQSSLSTGLDERGRRSVKSTTAVSKIQKHPAVQPTSCGMQRPWIAKGVPIGAMQGKRVTRLLGEGLGIFA